MDRTTNCRKPFAALLVASALLALLVSCRSPHLRIDTDPNPARLTLLDENMEFATPCDLRVSPGTRIRVEREGYLPFEGRIDELPRVGKDSYKAVLRPR